MAVRSPPARMIALAGIAPVVAVVCDECNGFTRRVDECMRPLAPCRTCSGRGFLSAGEAMTKAREQWDATQKGGE